MRDCAKTAPTIVPKQMRLDDGRGVYWPRVNGTFGDWSVLMDEDTPLFETLPAQTVQLLQYRYPMFWGVLRTFKVGSIQFECAALFYNANARPQAQPLQHVVAPGGAPVTRVGV